MLYEDLPIIISFHSLRFFLNNMTKRKCCHKLFIHHELWWFYYQYCSLLALCFFFVLYSSIAIAIWWLHVFFINMILHFHSSLCLPDCLCSWEHEKSKYMSSSKCAKDKRNRMFVSFGRKRRVLMIMSVKTRQILTWE